MPQGKRAAINQPIVCKCGVSSTYCLPLGSSRLDGSLRDKTKEEQSPRGLLVSNISLNKNNDRPTAIEYSKMELKSNYLFSVEFYNDSLTKNWIRRVVENKDSCTKVLYSLPALTI